MQVIYEQNCNLTTKLGTMVQLIWSKQNNNAVLKLMQLSRSIYLRKSLVSHREKNHSLTRKVRFPSAPLDEFFTPLYAPKAQFLISF